MRWGYVMSGDERLNFSMDALEAVGMKSGDALSSMDVWLELIAAESAALHATHAIWRAQASSILKGGQ